LANIRTTSTSGAAKGDLRQFVKDRLKNSAERNTGHLRLLRKFWRYYLTNSERRSGWRGENDRDPGSGAEWRANLFVPASFSVIETAVPRLVFALFGKRPYVRIVGRERSDIANADAVSAMMEYDFEQAQVSHLAVEFFKSFYIFGTSVARIDHHEDFYEIKHPPKYTIDIEFDEDSGEVLSAKERRLKNVERVSRYEGPRLSLVSLFDFFPDPQFCTIEEMRYVIEREETTLDKLKHENKIARAITGKNKYTGVEDIPRYHDGQVADLGQAEDFRNDTAEVMRFNYGWGGVADRAKDKDDDTVVLYHYWEDERYVVMANGHTIIRDGENPYNDKRKPFVAARCFPTLKEFYGQGLLAPIQFLQEELNTLRNIALDQGKLNLYGIWAIDENLTLSDADIAVYPGKTFYTEFAGGKPNIAQVFDSQLPPDYERLENRVQRDIQSTLAINDYMIGAGSGSAGTASEASMLNASAGNRFRLQAMLANDEFLVKTADMFLARRQQFLSEGRVFRILGEQGYDYPVIGPENIAGRYDFMPEGSPAQPNKEVERQQLLQLTAIAGGNPILAAQTKWDELYKELWSRFDVRWPERFLVIEPAKQLTQKQENLIIMQGEKVMVDPNENHQEHAQDLLAILPDVIQSADTRIQDAYQDHDERHQRYLQQISQTPGQAQQPGGNSGAPGNQPNMAEQQTPSLPSMQAAVMGGPGGPVS
jgi:hypothetical protein